jgi:hypothetical protein
MMPVYHQDSPQSNTLPCSESQSYRDFSCVPDEAVGNTTAEAIAIMTRDQPSFPVRLHRMLEQLEDGEADLSDDVAGWEVHGR